MSRTQIKRGIVLAEDLEQVKEGSEYPVPAGFVVSDLAREAAQSRSIALVEAGPDLIALGADHGGYQMKEVIKQFLGESGFGYHDFGTYDESPVDYPDMALVVALAVARGQCSLGILVDGAGIGSCMAANKVPRVLAALCYDEATARNSREHNYANVLTLGGRMRSVDQVKSIVKTWLSTPYGADRHRRRVEKIRQIEKRYH